METILYQCKINALLNKHICISIYTHKLPQRMEHFCRMPQGKCCMPDNRHRGNIVLCFEIPSKKLVHTNEVELTQMIRNGIMEGYVSYCLLEQVFNRYF